MHTALPVGRHRHHQLLNVGDGITRHHLAGIPANLYAPTQNHLLARSERRWLAAPEDHLFICVSLQT